MAGQLTPGRFIALTDEPFVVFIVGMRINRLWHLRKWTFGVLAFIKQYKLLLKHPEKGFMGGQHIIYPRGMGMIMYWKSYDDLDKWARDPSEPHLETWKRYNQLVRGNGTFGVWHETYLIDPAKYEAIYSSMPSFALGTVFPLVPALGRKETARRRLGGDNEVIVESPAKDAAPPPQPNLPKPTPVPN
ncbi:DUF4188 domain-containing protein [Streptosporangiaceae bacterium NEAU-GS5]|nr:DUF4188 domain-containing protein [Streptosporangiaceae bacterium NEAU-GS5]